MEFDHTRDDEAAESASPLLDLTEAETLAQPDSPAPLSTGRRRPRRRSVMVIGGFVLLGVIFAVVGTVWTQPYYALAPGSVRDTATRIEIIGADIFEPQGQIGFVTVSLTERVNMFEYVTSKFDDSVDLVAEEIINGDGTSEEKREQDRRRMQESKDTATLVALNHLGYELVPIGLGIEVVELTPCMPAEEVLKVGDLIIGLNGVEVGFTEDLTGPLASLAPGDRVELDVDRFDTGEVETVDFALGSSAAACLPDEFRDAAADERAMIGIRLSPMIDYELPVDVVIDTDRVGGPSAGLAFTLSVIDVLSPGELTGGASVATTGTIDFEGNVGRVGGVKQKTVAAEAAGIELFLVPVGEADEATQFASEMIVEEVANLDDALAALDRLREREQPSA